MVSKYFSVLLALNVFVLCHSAFVDTLLKCSINDRECTKKLLQKMLNDVAKTGVEEIELQPIDPVTLKNITITIPDFGEFTMVDGQVKGIKDCIIDKVETNLEDERAYYEFTCDITVKGKYKVFSDSPLIKNFLNAKSVHGEGNGKVKIDKLKIKLEFSFSIKKRNGDYYIYCRTDKTKYDFDVKGGMKFYADKIYIGDVESSKLLTGLLNDNWRLLIGAFGRPFMKEIMGHTYVFINRFFYKIPAKYFLTDDLSPYATDDES